MQTRRMMIAVLIGGSLLGTLMGVAANPTMVPPPEPAWRQARPDPIYREPQQVADIGQQYLSPTWYEDRLPTWKRRALAREQAAYEAAMQQASYPAYEPEPAAPPPEAETQNAPPFPAKVVTWPAAEAEPAAPADAAPAEDAAAPSGPVVITLSEPAT